MIAVFLYPSCYDVTMLHCYTFVKTFQYPLLFAFFEKLFMFRKDVFAFCQGDSWHCSGL